MFCLCRGASGPPVFLWLKKGVEMPITRIDVTFGEEEAAEGFEKLKQSFNSAPNATFGVERAADQEPITDLKITYDETRKRHK